MAAPAASGADHAAPPAQCRATAGAPRTGAVSGPRPGSGAAVGTAARLRGAAGPCPWAASAAPGRTARGTTGAGAGSPRTAGATEPSPKPRAPITPGSLGHTSPSRGSSGPRGTGDRRCAEKSGWDARFERTVGSLQGNEAHTRQDGRGSDGGDLQRDVNSEAVYSQEAGSLSGQGFQGA